ncbi:hypothetical protein [Neobacillus ginsengisoli]|uniref:Uncharacterized protein n=1 Tax=Neobacillus ginsengisoli TaxID=904295 RepID=A0ABT9Y433_9BACI|nr:hypothetical protein [Neobacillus ginsengisoli]MDQ0201942.1 hypothetical protein [Neobacillus ginsengisoli]
MTNQLLEEFFRNQGYIVENVLGQDHKTYIVIRNYCIPAGSLAGKTCHVGIEQTSSVPYVAPPAIHTFPVLIPMDMSSNLRTQPIGLGPEWQYWSRVLRVPPIPKAYGILYRYDL